MNQASHPSRLLTDALESNGEELIRICETGSSKYSSADSVHRRKEQTEERKERISRRKGSRRGKEKGKKEGKGEKRRRRENEKNSSFLLIDIE